MAKCVDKSSSDFDIRYCTQDQAIPAFLRMIEDTASTTYETESFHSNAHSVDAADASDNNVTSTAEPHSHHELTAVSVNEKVGKLANQVSCSDGQFRTVSTNSSQRNWEILQGYRSEGRGGRGDEGEEGGDEGFQNDDGNDDDEGEDGEKKENDDEEEDDEESEAGDPPNDEEEEEEDDAASEDESQPVNDIDNEITEIPSDANPRTVFIKVIYNFDLKNVNWQPHLLQFSPNLDPSDFLYLVKEYVREKLRKEEQELCQELQRKGHEHFILFRPSLESDDPVKRHAFEFEEGTYPRCRTIEDFFPDPDNLRPALTLRLDHKDMRKTAPGVNPFVEIQFPDRELFNYYRSGSFTLLPTPLADGSEEEKALPPTLRRIKQNNLLFWRVDYNAEGIPEEKEIRAIQAPAWRLRKFDIYDMSAARIMKASEYPPLRMKFDDPAEKKIGSTYVPLRSSFMKRLGKSIENFEYRGRSTLLDFRTKLKDRVLYCFNTMLPPGIGVPAPPDAIITAALRFVSHFVTEDGNPAPEVKFENFEQLEISPEDDYSDVRKAVMENARTQKAAKGFFRELANTSQGWDVQLWVLLQTRLSDDSNMMYRYHSGNRLCDFLAEKHFNKQDFRIFMEVHIVPVAKPQQTTRSDRTVGKRGRAR
ncbi:hypothetical protein Q7P37_011401 [Cladosporium fusiforme]